MLERISLNILNIGEARACWSLGNAHSAIGNHDKALQFAESHLQLAKELQDPVGESTARVNISDLRKLLGMPESAQSPTMATSGTEAMALGERSSNSDISAAGDGHQSDCSDSSQGRMVSLFV